MIACQVCLPEIAELLLKSGASVTLENNDHRNTLMIACKCGADKCVELLLNNSAVGVDVQNSEGETALMIACGARQKNTVQLLLNKRANINL